MDNNWKFVIKIVAALMSLVIVCVTINSVVNKLTATVGAVGNQQGYNQQGTDINNPGFVDNGQANDSGFVSDPAGGNVTDSGNPAAPVTPSGNTSGNVRQPQAQNNSASNSNTAAGDPTTFNKNQIVDYYNQCLRKAYSQPKFTVTKTEKIDVQLGEMNLNGKPATNLQGMANKVVASNAAKGGTKTKNFTNSTAVVNAQERFILPSNLNPIAVKSYNVSKSGAGYVIHFTLNEEKCDFKSKPPYNSSCTFPLDFNEIDLGGFGQITSAQFYYSGTTLTATIDGQGRVVKTDVVMPLSVDNASGQGMGQTLTMDISGKWLCTNINQF